MSATAKEDAVVQQRWSQRRRRRTVKPFRNISDDGDDNDGVAAITCTVDVALSRVFICLCVCRYCRIFKRISPSAKDNVDDIIEEQIDDD